jgi:hypothetical protein
MLSSACLGDELPTGAHTVDLGDNFEAPDRSLDADFFHCVIQPEVVTRHSCSAGEGSDSGGCHSERSALRLLEVDSEPRCEDNMLLGPPSPASETNFDRIRVTVGSEADSSPFFRRPTGLDTHPRVIFDENSDSSQLVREWINSGIP